MKKPILIILALAAIAVGIYFYLNSNEERDIVVTNETESYDTISYLEHLKSEHPDAYEYIYGGGIRTKSTKSDSFGNTRCAIVLTSFHHAYMNQVNPGTINTSNKVNVNSFMNKIYFNQIHQSSQDGISFYPVINNNEFTFVFSNARKDSNGINPITFNPSGNIEYYLLHNNQSELINDSLFNILASLYQLKYVRNKIGVKSQIIGLKHPGACFYKGKELDSFFRHNHPATIAYPNQLPQFPGNYDVRFENVGQFHTGVDSAHPSDSFSLHSAIMTLFDGVNMLRNNPSDPLYKYKMKSMDFGQLCPPNCN